MEVRGPRYLNPVLCNVTSILGHLPSLLMVWLWEPQLKLRGVLSRGRMRRSVVHACSVRNAQGQACLGRGFWEPRCPSVSGAEHAWGQNGCPQWMGGHSFRCDVAVGLKVASFSPYNLFFPSFSVSNTLVSSVLFYINSILSLSCLPVYSLFLTHLKNSFSCVPQIFFVFPVL